MVLYCAALDCKSNGLEPGISFHKFPKNSLQEVWLEKMQRQAMIVTENTVLCSKHFLRSDYVNPTTKKRKLVADAVPSIFPWTKVIPEKILKRDYSKISTLTNGDASLSIRNCFCIESIRNRDQLVELYTGFKSYQHFNSAFRFLLPASSNKDDFINYFQANSQVLLEADYSNNETLFMSSPEDQFLMTLMKFRLGLPTADLAFRFSISHHLATTILTTWINYMYNRFSSSMIWPQRFVLLSNSPKTFVINYPGVIAVIAAVQLPIDCSRCVSGNKLTECRCLIVCDPNGAILFTSQMYKKDISFKDLAKKCGLLKLLTLLVEKGNLVTGDIILLESVIDISEDLESLNLKSKYYEKIENDDEWPVNISLAALKKYSFFDGRPIPFEMLDLLDQMWTSVCFMISLFSLVDKSSSDLLL